MKIYFDIMKRCQEKFPAKEPPTPPSGVRGRAKVRLGIGLGLKSEGGRGLFPAEIFS